MKNPIKQEISGESGLYSMNLYPKKSLLLLDYFKKVKSDEKNI